MKKTTSITNINELHIGDMVCKKGQVDPYEASGRPLFVVGLFAEPDELTPSCHTGTVYCDFEDNPGDVLEFSVDELDKIIND